MEEERENSARTVRYFSGGGYYVHSCPPDVSICSQVPGFETTITGQQIGSNISTSSLALLGAVNAIDSDEDEEKEDHSYVDIVTDGQSKLNDSSSLNAADEIDSDDDSISYSVNGSSSLLPAEASKAALDLCPAIDTSMLKSDSESESEESSEESEADVDSDNYDSEYGESVGKPSNDCYLPSWETDYLPVDQVDGIIRTDMKELEVKKPWRSVFRCLDVPFGFRHRDDPFDIFFMRWDEFWHTHGRAVWERDFWQPLRPGSTEYYRRKSRQRRAMRDFRDLATDLVARLGESYRRWLANVLREGWWYRTEPFTLRRLFLRDRHLYKEYLKCRAQDRWPRGKKVLVERGLRPMWWVPESATKSKN